jgi:hypothetical protein
VKSWPKSGFNSASIDRADFVAWLDESFAVGVQYAYLVCVVRACMHACCMPPYTR